MSDSLTTTLFRPVGQAELDLIAALHWLRFPPRLSWQPIFYPVVSEDYAREIAKKWNTRDANSGFVGYVLQFQVASEYLKNYEIHEVGGKRYREYWIPAEELDSFNDHLVGRIEVLHTFRGTESKPV